MTEISYDDVRVGDKIRATYTWRDQDVVRTGVVARRTPDGSLWTEKGTVIVGPASQGLIIELLEREVAVGTVAVEWVYIGRGVWAKLPPSDTGEYVGRIIVTDQEPEQ
jgi:hypothetical protein